MKENKNPLLMESEQHFSKELVVAGEGADRAFEPGLIENAVLLNQLPILATNMMQVAKRMLSRRIPAVAIASAKNGTPSKLTFDEFGFNEKGWPVSGLNNQIDGCWLAEILIENFSILHLKPCFEIVTVPVDILGRHELLKRLEVFSRYQRPHEIEEHRLAAKTVVQVFVERESDTLFCAFLFFAIDEIRHFFEDDVGRPLAPFCKDEWIFLLCLVSLLLKERCRSVSKLRLELIVTGIRPGIGSSATAAFQMSYLFHIRCFSLYERQKPQGPVEANCGHITKMYYKT